jgi:hypothetical protein
MTELLKTRLHVLYCWSGFVGVLAEQVFEKLLSVVVGASTPSAATVLAVYFAGSQPRWLRRFHPDPSQGSGGADIAWPSWARRAALWLLQTFDTGVH